MDKSRDKSPKRRGRVENLIPGKGRGPKKGAPNAGRPRSEWIARLQGLASSDAVLDEVERALLAGRTDPFFKDALHYVTDHGYGRATQPVDVTSNGLTLESLLAKPVQEPNVTKLDTDAPTP